MKKQLKMILTAILLENTPVISSDMVGIAGEIAGENNAASSTQLAALPAPTQLAALPAPTQPSLIQAKINTDELIGKIWSYLSLPHIVNMKSVNRWWKSQVSQGTDHLNHRVLERNLSAHLTEGSTLAFPFHLAPKKVAQIVDDQNAWEMILPLLKNARHDAQDRKLFLEHSLRNVKAIDDLKNTHGLMDELGLSQEIQNIIGRRALFLRDLRGIEPTLDILRSNLGMNIFNFVSKQADRDLKFWGYLFIAQKQNISASVKMNAAGALKAYGEKYYPEVAHCLFSIMRDCDLDLRGYYHREYRTQIRWCDYRISDQLINSFIKLGENYYPKFFQGLLAIMQGEHINEEDKIGIASLLLRLRDRYDPEGTSLNPEIAKILLSVMGNGDLKDLHRLDAAMQLAKLGDNSRPELAQGIFDMMHDSTVGDLKEIYVKNQHIIDFHEKERFADAMRSIIEDVALCDEYRLSAKTMLAFLE